MKLGEREHLRRIVTGIAGIALIGTLYACLRHQAVQLVTVVVGLVAYFEYLRILISASNTLAFRSVKIAIALASAVIYLLPVELSYIWAFGLLIVCTLAIYRFWETDASQMREHRYHLEDLFVAGFGLFYIVGFLSFVPQIHLLPDGSAWLAGLVAIIWACDIAAYYGGQTLGKHKLAYVISPGKTLEGSISGIAGGIAVGYALQHFWLPWASPAKVILLAFLTSLISQLGDLFESLLKRVVGVKDSGFLLPGHGGMLDRFDSLILAAPFYYLMLHLWIV